MDDAAFQSAFHAHKDAVYRFAWRMLSGPEAAEDIAQEIFLTLLRQPERFDASRGELRSFLFGVARNLALKRWREENRWGELDDDATFDALFNPAEAALRGEIAERVSAAVQALPPYQREALILAEYEECSLEEIASIAGVEVGTVKSRLFRARENVRRVLAPLLTNSSQNGARGPLI